MLIISIVFTYSGNFMKFFKIIVVIYFLSFSVNGQKTFIHAGRLIDGVKDIPIEMVTIIINGNIIQSVLRGHLEAGDNDRVIDLKNYTILPGLMDMHTHLSGQSNPKVYM